MAKFVRIKVGKDNLPYLFNLEAIESVDLQNKRVYTIGVDQPYHIYDQASWEKILKYTNANAE
jgi:hypothetical protein